MRHFITYAAALVMLLGLAGCSDSKRPSAEPSATPSVQMYLREVGTALEEPSEYTINDLVQALPRFRSQYAGGVAHNTCPSLDAQCATLAGAMVSVATKKRADFMFTITIYSKAVLPSLDNAYRGAVQRCRPGKFSLGPGTGKGGYPAGPTQEGVNRTLPASLGTWESVACTQHYVEHDVQPGPTGLKFVQVNPRVIDQSWTAARADMADGKALVIIRAATPELLQQARTEFFDRVQWNDSEAG